MLNLDVSTDKIADLKKLFNDANVYHRIVGTSSDGLTTTLKFNKKVDFDKAKEIIDGKVAIQATLKRSSPVSKVSIGDAPIDWCADQGDPSIVAGATISDDAFYDTINNGVVLTEEGALIAEAEFLKSVMEFPAKLRDLIRTYQSINSTALR